MSSPWCYLVSRYGDETGPLPTSDEIWAVVNELYSENLPGMTEGDYDEHGVASLRYGYDEGPMCVLEITRHGTARWEEWADQDYEVELCPVRVAKSLPEATAFFLCEQMAAGELDDVRGYFRMA